MDADSDAEDDFYDRTKEFERKKALRKYGFLVQASAMVNMQKASVTRNIAFDSGQSFASAAWPN